MLLLDKIKYLIILIFISTFVFSAIIGGYASDYFDYGIGARTIAMGNAGRTVASDASSGYWNSALLANVIDFSFSSMSTELMGSTMYNYLGISFPLSLSESIAINYWELKLNGLQLHLKSSNPDSSPDGYFDVGNSVAMISYGKAINDIINVGLSAKYGYRSLAQSNDSVMAFDFGFLLNLETFKMGGNIRNIYSLKMGSETEDEYGVDFDIGASLQIADLLVSLDFARFVRGKGNLYYYLGGEYKLFHRENVHSLAIRAGYNPNEKSLGLGFFITPFNMDYTYLLRENDYSHIFSIGIQFNNNALSLLRQKAQYHYEQAIASAKENNYNKLHHHLKDGIRIYPENIDLQNLKKRMLIIEPFIKLEEDIPNQYHQFLFRVSVRNFLLDNHFDSLEHLEYLLLEYNNLEIRNMRKLIEEYSSNIYSYKNRNFIEIMLNEATGYLFINDIEKSNILLEKIVYFEPNNIIALKRLGSNYYVQKNNYLAAKYWKRVLEINPNDSEIVKHRNFIEKYYE
jgi:hypothetical protein